MSSGLKRYISVILGALATLASTRPELEFLVTILNKLAAVIGVVGLSHAAGKQDLAGSFSLSIGALLQLLIGASEYVSEIKPFVPFLQELVLFVAAFNGGKVKALSDAKK